MPKILTPKTITRPLSPDTPEILSELQRYTKVPYLPPSGVATPETASQKGAVMILPQNNTASPGMEMPLDLRGTKRKSTSPSTNEYSSKQSTPEQRGSVPPSGQNYPFTGIYGLNSSANPGVHCSLLSSLNSMWSSYFQPQVPIVEHQLMFQISPETYSLRDGALPSSSPTSSSITSRTAATSSSSISVPSSCLMRHEVPGMLVPTFLSQYGQPLGIYPSTLMPQGIPGQAGSSFLPQYASSGPQGSANESCLIVDNEAPRSEDNSHMCDNHHDVIAMMEHWEKIHVAKCGKISLIMRTKSLIGQDGPSANVASFCSLLQVWGCLSIVWGILTTNMDKVEKKILMLNILFKNINFKECSNKTVGENELRTLFKVSLRYCTG